MNTSLFYVLPDLLFKFVFSYFFMYNIHVCVIYANFVGVDQSEVWLVYTV